MQGVLQTPLADAADIVLPGSAFVEKDATYTNMTGHVQAASRVIPPPGDAGEDWQILMKLGARVRRNRRATRRRPPCVRRSRSAARGIPGYAALATIDVLASGVRRGTGCRRRTRRERWKWDFMFQDLPPIKFGEDFGPLPRAEVIPLKEVK